MAVDDAGIVVEDRVDLRLLGNRLHHRAHQERQDRQFRAVSVALGVEAGAQFLERLDTDFLDIGDVRDARFRPRHLLYDAAAQADDLDLLDRRVWLRPCRRGLLRAAADELVEIVMGDAPGRAGAVNLAQVYPRFLRAQ